MIKNIRITTNRIKTLKQQRFPEDMVIPVASIIYNGDKHSKFRPIIILRYNSIFEMFMRQYNKTIEQMTCSFLTHEYMHYFLFMLEGEKASEMFDNLTDKLLEYC